ncbi:hypothetical protein, partial [Klebsiella pneumoniae]|uniref:hypothetical protein n=1 Tax=Klebsiella pneumoniae TaxID=573 RepID=UPI00200F879C
AGDSDLRNDLFRFGDGSTFLHDKRQAIAGARTISLYLDATAVELVTDLVSNAVVSVRAMAAPERELTCSAKTFVIAAGGLAVPQILLGSNQQ